MSTPGGYRPSYQNCNGVSALCPVEATTYGDYFDLAACVVYTVFYSICFVYQMIILFRYRTWSFSIFLGIGTAFELMGYAARIAMTPGGDPWNYPAFVIQLLMLILAPTFVAAGISVTFKWIVIEYGPQYSIMRPKWYPWVFVGTDFLSIVIQAVGGAVSAGATGSNPNPALLDAGSGLLVAGVAFQAANMIFCGGLMVIFWVRYRRGEARRGSEATATEEASGIWPTTRFRKYCYAIIAAYLAIVIRCIYRIPEMALGWGSTLMRNETLFLILDGMMIAIAVLLLTIVHPAFFFPVLRRTPKAAAASLEKPPAPTPPDATPADV